MIIDLEVADPGDKIQADVCIVGAGPAGITLALELEKLNSKLSICLLESGGEEYEVDTQNLYVGNNLGREYFPLNVTRLRQLGGSSGHWSGWCAPLNELDFADRDWVENSGWPIPYQELAKYYERANDVLNLGAARYDMKSVAEYFPELSNLTDGNVVSRFWQFSKPPIRFGQYYKESLNQSQSINVFLHANVTNINLLDNFRSIAGVDVSTLDGTKKIHVTANNYVLACGGIENARILLNSNSQIDAGIGNSHDIVGRYFMEHIEAECATIHDANLGPLSRFKQMRYSDGQIGGGAFCPSDALQAENKIGNCAAYFRAQQMTGDLNGWSTLLNTVNKIKNGHRPQQVFNKLGKVIKDFDLIVNVLILNGLKKPLTPIVNDVEPVRVISMAEQVPNRESRIQLSTEKDVLGKQKADMNWRLTNQDYTTIRETMMALASDLARSGMGRMKLDDWLVDNEGNWSESTRGGHHHMGTTRMADSLENGVVNADCKIFGIENGYVTGSSVFPTGGYANPTLSIVALAIRLAENLAEKSQGT